MTNMTFLNKEQLLLIRQRRKVNLILRKPGNRYIFFPQEIHTFITVLLNSKRLSNCSLSNETSSNIYTFA